MPGQFTIARNITVGHRGYVVGMVSPIDPLDADDVPSLPYLSHTTMVIEAIDLIDGHGDGALVIAATRAVEARNAGNALRFCHWRQTERLIALLRSGRVYGAIH